MECVLVPAVIEFTMVMQDCQIICFLSFFTHVNYFTRLLLDDIMFEVVYGLDKFIKQPCQLCLEGQVSWFHASQMILAKPTAVIHYFPLKLFAGCLFDSWT